MGVYTVGVKSVICMTSLERRCDESFFDFILEGNTETVEKAIIITANRISRTRQPENK